jgi:hypothetical protein
VRLASYRRESLAAELTDRLPVAFAARLPNEVLPSALAVAWLERGVNADTEAAQTMPATVSYFCEGAQITVIIGVDPYGLCRAAVRYHYRVRKPPLYAGCLAGWRVGGFGGRLGGMRTEGRIPGLRVEQIQVVVGTG